MAERGFENEASNVMRDVNEAASRVREDVEKFVEGFDFQAVSKKVEEFGRGNPMGLAVMALGLGVAAGFMMRSGRSVPQEEFRFK